VWQFCSFRDKGHHDQIRANDGDVLKPEAQEMRPGRHLVQRINQVAGRSRTPISFILVLTFVALAMAPPMIQISETLSLHRTCPLLGVKQTSQNRPVMSAYDPKRTWAVSICCDAQCGPIGEATRILTLVGGATACGLALAEGRSDLQSSLRPI
jgi:hypothetical protein